MKDFHIKNAFLNIKKACDSKLKLLYPHGIPEIVHSRYEQELTFMKDSEYLNDFEIFRLLSLDAKKCSSYFTMRGTVTGSLIYYLLGHTCYNPLPPHYYCPDCGHFEIIDTHLLGIDLPEKECPVCKKTILGDGFNLPLESVWGNDGKKIISFDYNVSPDFLPFAKQVLLALYPNNVVVPRGMFCQKDNSYEHINVDQMGFAILPSERTIQDYPDLLAYLEDGESCLCGGSWELANHNIKVINIYPHEATANLITLQNKTGKYIEDISVSDIRNITWRNIYNAMLLNHVEEVIFSETKPQTITDMVSITACSHNSYADMERNKYGDYDPYTLMDLFKEPEFIKHPCHTREDFFDYLCESGVERSDAFYFSECIRKGWANSAKYKEQYESFNMPEDLKELGRKYLYLFPRAHCIEYLLLFARTAYYANIDSRVFSKVIYKKN